MRRHYLPIVLVLATVLALGAAIIGCDSANPIAPMGSTLTVTASPTLIGLSENSLITVTGFRPDGNPLNPGTRINLATDLGVLDSTIVEIDDNGRAQTRLRGDGRTGPATVTASLPAGDAMAMAMVQIGQSMETRPTLSIVVSPSTLSLGETASVDVEARSADGSRFGAGGRVALRTSLGSLDANNLVTDANGEASTTFNSGDQPGTATITGSVESSDEVTADVTIENQKPVLIMSANPDDIAVGQTSTITILARDENDVPLGASEVIQLFSSLGSVPETVQTNSSGRAEATFESGDLAGTATIQAVLRNSDAASVDVNIRDAVREFLFTANPLTIDRPVQDATATIRLTGTVRNAQGQPLNNILVTFTSPNVGGTFQTTSGATSNGTAQTGGQGVAELDLIVNSSGVGNRDSFAVMATVVSEGEVFERTVTIEVRN